jgi:hypothetical protein
MSFKRLTQKYYNIVEADAALSEDEIYTICRWVESSSDDDIRAAMLKLKGNLPYRYRRVSGSVYRGAAATGELLDHLNKGGSVKTNEVESWSLSSTVAENFMHDTGYEFGILFTYKPDKADVIVNMEEANQECDMILSEDEVVLGQVTLSKENVVKVRKNKGFDGKKRQDNMEIAAAAPHYDSLKKWLDAPDAKWLPKIKPIEGEDRVKALKLLATKTKKVGDKYLLHRGTYKDNKIKGDVFKDPYRTAWSAKESVAKHFAKDREREGIVISAWVHSDNIVTVAFYEYPEHEGSKEYEVIVEAGVSLEIENKYEVEAYPPLGG